MESIGRNIKMWRARRGIGVNQLARLAKVDSGNMSKMEGGQMMPSVETLGRIAAALGVPASELLVEDTNIEYGQEGTRRVRVLAWDEVGLPPDISSHQTTDDLKDYLLVDMEFSRDVFALSIRGDVMEPTFHEGDTIIVERDLKPRPGDFVVAVDGKGEAMFKMFRDMGLGDHGESIFALLPLNVLYASHQSDKEPLKIVATMVEHRRKRRP